MKSSRHERAIEGKFDRTDLGGLQTALYRLIVAPNGVEEALASASGLPSGGLDPIIVNEGSLSARERLEIYANAYFYRVLDVLKEEFPATLAVIGEVNFHNLITGYLIEYPPTEPSILYAGRYLPDFIRTYPLSDQTPYLGDLARLERTALEIFHAADASVLDGSTMREIPPHEWPTMVMRRHPATCVLNLQWRVDELLSAVENGEPWREPEPCSNSLLVWRQNSKVNYRVLQREERAGLELAGQGATFESICEAVGAATNSDEDLAASINRMLTRWLSEGLLTRES
jgi:hypothetical protein